MPYAPILKQEQDTGNYTGGYEGVTIALFACPSFAIVNLGAALEDHVLVLPSPLLRDEWPH